MDDKTFNALKKLFDKGNKEWKALFDEHDEASKQARNGMGKTTGLKGEKVYEKVADYMAKHEYVRGKGVDPKELKTHHKGIYLTKARQIIAELAKNNHMEVSQYMNKLSQEGLEEIFGAYDQSEKRQDMQLFGDHLIRKKIKQKDASAWAKYLRKLAPSQMHGIEDHDIASKIHEYFRSHMTDYMTKAAPAEKKH